MNEILRQQTPNIVKTTKDLQNYVETELKDFDQVISLPLVTIKKAKIKPSSG